MINRKSSLDLTLVPFGYSQLQGRLVDVHQVPSGKRCGCVCPSCKAPLIARKGNKKIWHFAHDSSSEAFQELERCSYSFFVSARMMARQLIGDSLEVALPDFEIVLSGQGAESDYPVHVSESVTTSRQVRLHDVVVDAELNGQRFDILGYVGEHSLAFLLTHPGRDGFPLAGNHAESGIGMVAIALDGLKDEFRKLRSPDDSYGDILTNYIANDTTSKKWIFHPRQQQAEEKARAKLAKALSKKGRAISHARRASSPIRKLPGRQDPFNEDLLAELGRVEKANNRERTFKYVCRLCNSSWVGVGNVDASCKQCNNSLLVSRVELDT